MDSFRWSDVCFNTSEPLRLQTLRSTAADLREHGNGGHSTLVPPPHPPLRGPRGLCCVYRRSRTHIPPEGHNGPVKRTCMKPHRDPLLLLKYPRLVVLVGEDKRYGMQRAACHPPPQSEARGPLSPPSCGLVHPHVSNTLTQETSVRDEGFISALLSFCCHCFYEDALVNSGRRRGGGGGGAKPVLLPTNRLTLFFRFSFKCFRENRFTFSSQFCYRATVTFTVDQLHANTVQHAFSPPPPSGQDRPPPQTTQTC